ncbi:MAG: hypothetical protein LC624_09630 [Halobacteriales archaeon]|nr:hypothetical protein [Halobacteriales archaeon]
MPKLTEALLRPPDLLKPPEMPVAAWNAACDAMVRERMRSHFNAPHIGRKDAIELGLDRLTFHVRHPVGRRIGTFLLCLVLAGLFGYGAWVSALLAGGDPSVSGIPFEGSPWVGVLVCGLFTVILLVAGVASLARTNRLEVEAGQVRWTHGWFGRVRTDAWPLSQVVEVRLVHADGEPRQGRGRPQADFGWRVGIVLADGAVRGVVQTSDEAVARECASAFARLAGPTVGVAERRQSCEPVTVPDWLAFQAGTWPKPYAPGAATGALSPTSPLNR